jgi:hypothetical protein
MSRRQLQLFSVYHLNLAYSSVEVAQRIDILQKCYWPILRLARRHKIPFGIEASVYTLECIRELDSHWLSEFGALCDEGICELVGSGYVQLIGPLVPSEVNATNLRLGNAGYQSLLGLRPQLALINEQAYSAGLLRHYIDAGFRAIIMEWDNPVHWHQEWQPSWRYLPQIACGQHGEEIPVIWNKSIAFQKFQRLAHGEMDFGEYLRYLTGHLSETPRAFPIYGNDVEVFDFRPGRFQTEPKLEEIGEWQRIDRLFEMLCQDERFRFIQPSQVLDLMVFPGAGNRLHLESAEDPVPVKKQGKYNITRWAVTGRNDLGINTVCHRIYEALKERNIQDDESWCELCYLWSSDFRTHITERRWVAYLKRLSAMEARLSGGTSRVEGKSMRAQHPSGFRSQREGRLLRLEGDLVEVVLNCRRGFAIDSLVVKNVSSRSLVGTVQHGYYQDISLAADFYSGHLVLEMPGQPKITDLSAVEPEVGSDDDGESVIVQGVIPTPLGPIRKRIRVRPDGQLTANYDLQWEQMPPGALRLAHVTLNPEAFDRGQLYFESHNGGPEWERFSVGQKRIEHGRTVSFLVSATGAIGMTKGQFALGDHARRVQVQTRMDEAAVVAQVTFVPLADSYFYRMSFSAAELDETCRNRRPVDFPRSLAFTITAIHSQVLARANKPASTETSVQQDIVGGIHGGS